MPGNSAYSAAPPVKQFSCPPLQKGSYAIGKALASNQLRTIAKVFPR
jgi:hypothetical protein